MSPRPVYWKPRYATRHMRERAFAAQQRERDAQVRRTARRSLAARLLARLRGNA